MEWSGVEWSGVEWSGGKGMTRDEEREERGEREKASQNEDKYMCTAGALVWAFGCIYSSDGAWRGPWRRSLGKRTETRGIKPISPLFDVLMCLI